MKTLLLWQEERLTPLEKAMMRLIQAEAAPPSFQGHQWEEGNGIWWQGEQWNVEAPTFRSASN